MEREKPITAVEYRYTDEKQEKKKREERTDYNNK